MLGVRNPLSCAIHMNLREQERMVHMLVGSDVMERAGYWGRNRCPPFIVSMIQSSLFAVNNPAIDHH